MCLLLSYGWWCTPALEPRNLTVLLPPTALGPAGIFLFSASPLWLRPVSVLRRFSLRPSLLLAVQEEAVLNGVGVPAGKSEGQLGQYTVIFFPRHQAQTESLFMSLLEANDTLGLGKYSLY